MGKGRYFGKHTFAVCAYKDSPYLEQCLRSLLVQTNRQGVIICTSTPSEYIVRLAQKYRIKVYVREGKSDIRTDWNFAYNNADTPYVTIVHQDDLYSKYYLEEVMTAAEKYEDSQIIYTDYYPINASGAYKKDLNFRLRKLLNTIMRFDVLANKSFFKRRLLSLGNSICCPTVTYNKKKLGDSVFQSELKYDIDWDTFYEIAKQDGRFTYIPKPLVCYRIHELATSNEFINNQKRESEDVKMFSKMWPDCIVKLLMKPYKKAYKNYG